MVVDIGVSDVCEVIVYLILLQPMDDDEVVPDGEVIVTEEADEVVLVVVVEVLDVLDSEIIEEVEGQMRVDEVEVDIVLLDVKHQFQVHIVDERDD